MKSSSVILIDIGNTSTHVALGRGGRFLFTKRIPSSATQSQTIRRLLKIYAGKKSGIGGAVLCSVVPRLNRIWLDELRKVVRGKILLVNHKLNLGVKVDYPCPATIGADRLANASAAAEKYGVPVVVADFGTALTFDIVSSAGKYVGGIIAPGPSLFADYLADKTALLPRLTLPAIRRSMLAQGKLPVVGKDTRRAMLIGLRLGYLGMVKEIFSRLRREKGLENARLCATGGYAGMILAKSGLGISIDPFLTLRGLCRIYRLNE